MGRIDFVVPIFNEEENIGLLIERMNAAADRIQADFELDVTYIFVDDGSEDNSLSRIEQEDFGSRQVLLRQFSRNFGKEAAISAGIEAANDSEAVVLMDSDLQHPPELAIELVRKWRETGADSVYAYKSDRRSSEGRLKDLLSKMFFRIINLNSRFSIRENAGDFRLINRKVMNALKQLPESERFMKGLYGWVGFRQEGIPFEPARRQHGTSSFRLTSLLLLTLDALTSFSVTPLRIMGLSGLLIAFLSVFYGIFIVAERLLTGTDSGGISSILALIAFFGGVQMVFLAMLGEYVGKAVLEAKRRPPFIVARDITFGSREAE